MTLDEARKQARKSFSLVDQGEDPYEKQKGLARIPTFSGWAEQYLEHVKQRKRSAREDVRYLGRAVKRFGSKRLDEVSADDIRKLFTAISKEGKPTTANRWLASVRSCLQAAWMEDHIESNPAMKVRLHSEAESARARVLNDEEFSRLCDVVSGLEDPHVRVAFTLLIVTGARLNEVLNAKWEDFNFESANWTIPTTKSRKPQNIPLPLGLLPILKEVPRLGPYVVPGRNPENRRADLKRPWDRVRKEARLENVVIHDIRRTHGHTLARDRGIYIASRLLRHSSVGVTEKHYAHLTTEDLREHCEATASNVIPMLQHKKKVGEN